MRIELYQPQVIYEVGQRKNQEDAVYPAVGAVTDQNRVFIVCDGMGGHEQGEVASAAVCQSLSQKAEALLDANRPFTDADMMAAMEAAEQALDRADVEKAGRMGTTMTFLCVHRGGCMVAHIGDSRIYHLRPETGEVLYRSRDHSLVQQLYEMGEISFNEMGTHPKKNIITKAMQPFMGTQKPTIVHIKDLRPGDYFYLCSDGMLEQMEDDELMALLQSDTSDAEKVEELKRRTIANADNHSAYLIRVKAVTPESIDGGEPDDEREARMKNKALNDTRKDEAWTDAEEEEMPVPTPVAPQAETQQARPKRSRGGLIGGLVAILLLIAAVVFFFFLNKQPASVDDKDEQTEQVVTEGDAADDESATSAERFRKPGKEPDALSPKPE